MYKLLKMLKHIIAIVACILCLLGVYVYFISQDIKKLNTDLKKSNLDVQSLVASISNLYKDINATKKKKRPIVITQETDFDEISSEDIKKIINEIDEESEEEEVVGEEIVEEDEEIPKELSEEDFDDINIDCCNQDVCVLEKDVIIEDEIESSKVIIDEEQELNLLPSETLKTYTIKQLREYCKKNNLSVNGTKDALISRIIIMNAA